MKRVHDTRLAARTALVDAGYTVAHSAPNRPELWVKLTDSGSRCAVARVVEGADETWQVVAYPEPDEPIGAVLNGGVDAAGAVPDNSDWLE